MDGEYIFGSEIIIMMFSLVLIGCIFNNSQFPVVFIPMILESYSKANLYKDSMHMCQQSNLYHAQYCKDPGDRKQPYIV